MKLTSKRLTQGWPGHLLALVAGALITLSLAPFNLWPLGIASLALLVWLLDDLKPGKAALRGWCYGLGMFGTGTSWVYVSIHVYGYAPVPLAVFLTALFSAGLGLFLSLPAYIYARWVRDCKGGPIFGFAAVFVLGEWWRSWFLTGFPWLFPGYGHLLSPLAGWAPVAGIYSLDFILACTAAEIARSLIRRRVLSKSMIAVIAMWLAGALLNLVNWVTPADRPPLHIAMVQEDIPQAIKWDPDQYLPTLQLYASTSEKLWRDNDIVIWPEAAIPAIYQKARGFLDKMGREAKAGHATLITGVPYLESRDGEVKAYNSIIALGDGSGLYHKQHLVPFGEYVPMQRWLRGLIQFFDLPMSDFSPGPVHQQGLKAGNLRLAPFICYEVVYPDLVASWMPDTDLLITISNDAWFGRSFGPLQHLQMAQMRALENGRYLLRSTGSGVSAIVDQRGHIVVRGGQFTREVIRGEAKVMIGATPFSETGSWPILAICGLLSIGLPLFAAKMRG